MTFNLANIHVPNLTGMVQIVGNRAVGSGNFADVWMANYTQPGCYKVTVAVKILRPTLLLDRRLATKTARKILREAKVWSTLNHPNVARFIGVCYEQERGEYIARLNDQQRVRLLRQFFSGLEYLHRKNVIHGDLKPTNVLLDYSYNAVLTDFGLSRVLEAAGFTTTNVKAAGTFRYMARELMTPMYYSTTAPLPTVQSDIWSAGMTGLEILSGGVTQQASLLSSTKWDMVNADGLLGR
ncbi:kinase-like domain-containing protein [Suillus cothurnatus]|nr:kinase-like domain-containing protein [Suillus cothurnatus]